MRSMAHLTGSRVFTRSTLNFYTGGGKDERAMQQRVDYENTYKTKPDVKFNTKKAEDIAREVLEENLKDIKYDTSTCRQLAQTLSTVMRNRVKELNFERYKIVCLVHIGEMGRQAMRIAGRCLWDHEVDTFASVVYETKSIYSVAIIYAVYQE